jgi:hypothetical protein
MVFSFLGSKVLRDDSIQAAFSATAAARSAFFRARQSALLSVEPLAIGGVGTAGAPPSVDSLAVRGALTHVVWRGWVGR